jgi:hypothetical protein
MRDSEGPETTGDAEGEQRRKQTPEHLYLA